MISVTAYDKTGEPRLYGRSVKNGEPVAQDVAEQVAEENARRLAADFIEANPHLGPIESWTFRRDACDRQLFAPSR